MSSTRNGEPVVEAKLSQILETPDLFDGKWVRVSGWIDAEKSGLFASPDYDAKHLRLNPASGRENTWDYPSDFTEATASGKVDLWCLDFHRKHRPSYGGVLPDGRWVTVSPGLKHQFCNSTSDAFLTHVVTSPSKSGTKRSRSGTPDE